MNERIITVRFYRDGACEGIPLDKDRIYQVIVDGGPPSKFRSPWSQEELENHIEFLRNSLDEKPTIEKIKEIGQQLGNAVFAINGFSKALGAEGAVTVYWQLDYPELARIPWELTASNQPPFHHLLLGNVSFVRKVPALVQDAPAEWPTGKNETLRLLFIWGEKATGLVPHKEHLKSLKRLCDDYGIELVAKEIPNIETLTRLVGRERFHFVHLLAHGALAGNGEWGLQLREKTVTGEQVARALVSQGTTPALVSISACDSANERDTSFGSVAYQLHVYGIPLVLASQFRLRTRVSTDTTAMVYKSILGRGDPRGILKPIRRQLAPVNNEGWANEVLYSRYRQESLDELTTIARQQAALRRARVIEKKAGKKKVNRAKFIHALEEESAALHELAAKLEIADPRNREHLAETYGLLGSLQQRMAKLRQDPPDPEALRTACDFYERGICADANSHYCGINVVHLSLRVGDLAKKEAFVPRTRFAAENAVEQGDFWAHATLGDLEVYEGQGENAAEQYRQFVRAAVQKRSTDHASLVKDFDSSRRPLAEILDIFKDAKFKSVREAAGEAIKVLDSAIKGHGR